MATAVVTDSTADVPEAKRERLHIETVPLKVNFGDETFLDGVTIQPGEFYRKLVAFEGHATTSQPSPAEFFDIFKRLTDEGRSVVSIHLSSAMSGTYQSATIAKSMLNEGADVTVIDSRSASYGYGKLVVHAAELAAAGAEPARIAAETLRKRKEMKLYFLVDTLEFLKRGGRIGKAAALLGTLLNIKPILSIDDEGSVFAYEKVRGQKKAMSRIADLLADELKDKPVDLAVGITPGFSDGADEMKELLLSRLNVRHAEVTEIGSVVGAHAGPGTIGVFVHPAD